MTNHPTTPNGVPLEHLTVAFAQMCLANGIPPNALAGAMAGTALDLSVQTVGIEGARLWISDVAALLVNYGEPL